MPDQYAAGVWTLLDTYSCCLTGTAYTFRNACYLGGGIVLLALSGTLSHHACIAPVHVLPRADAAQTSGHDTDTDDDCVSSESSWAHHSDGHDGATSEMTRAMLFEKQNMFRNSI